MKLLDIYLGAFRTNLTADIILHALFFYTLFLMLRRIFIQNCFNYQPLNLPNNTSAVIIQFALVTLLALVGFSAFCWNAYWGWMNVSHIVGQPLMPANYVDIMLESLPILILAMFMTGACLALAIVTARCSNTLTQ